MIVISTTTATVSPGRPPAFSSPHIVIHPFLESERRVTVTPRLRVGGTKENPNNGCILSSAVIVSRFRVCIIISASDDGYRSVKGSSAMKQ